MNTNYGNAIPEMIEVDGFETVYAGGARVSHATREAADKEVDLVTAHHRLAKNDPLTPRVKACRTSVLSGKFVNRVNGEYIVFPKD